jgi:hypothetical protein
LDKERREARAKEMRAQVLRLCLESLAVVFMLAFVFGGVVTLGRHRVATDTYRSYPQTAGRLVAYVDTESRVNRAQEEGLTDLCAVLDTPKGTDTPKGKDIDESSSEHVDCGMRNRTLGGSTRVPGSGH